jgi:hypothetical protein
MVAKTPKDSSKKLSRQGKAFVEAARAAECDEDEAQFEKRLKAVVKARPAEKSDKK